MGPTDYPPAFERKDSKFFLSENSPTGTVITKLKILSNLSANYEIVSDSDENPQFTIDSQGQVALARPLNFESQPTHLIGVLALTDSSPPLTALAEIVLQVQDENDHAPQFESSTYVLYLAENVLEGASIMKGIIFSIIIKNNIKSINFFSYRSRRGPRQQRGNPLQFHPGKHGNRQLFRHRHSHGLDQYLGETR